MADQELSAGQVVTAFITAIEAGDIEAAVAMAAESISYENMPIEPIVGRDGLRATLGSFLAPADEVDWKVLRQYETGGVVFNERLDRFRIGDGWLELPVAGVFEVDDRGLITLWRDYFDMGSYQSQFAELTGR
ncbi:MAG: limonene-1,2-epoxide hydrolase family protein [Acidimicrobiales bacterium]